MFSVVSVRHSVQGDVGEGSHVTINHDVLNLTVQGSLPLVIGYIQWVSGRYTY